MDNLDHEIKRLEAFSATRPYDPHIINRIGYLYYQKGDTKKAVECCKNSIMLFLKNGENEQAITLFEQAAYNDFFDFRTTEELLDSLHSKGLRKDVIHLSLKLAEKNLSTRRQVSHKLFEKVIDIDPKNRVARKYFEHSKEEGQIQTEQKRLKALDEELSSLKEEKTQIKEELSTRIEGLHQEISGYNAEVDRLHQTIQDKTKERDQIAQRADTAEARLKESVNKVAEIEKRLTEDIEALRGEIIQKDTELYKTQEMHIAAEKQLQTLHVDVSSLRDEKARVEAEFRGRIEGLQKEVAEFHAKVNDLTLTTREKERIEEDIERRLKESVKESVALRSNIDELTFVVQEKTKEQEIIAHRLDDTEKSLGKTRDRLAKAERNHEKTEQRMKNEITYLQEVLIQKEDLLSQTQELSAAEKNELLQKITAMKDMSDELQVPHFLDMVAVKEAEIIEVQESLTETIERMNSLEDEISSLETAYQEAEDDRQQKDELIEAVRAELSSIQVEKTHNEGELRGTIGGLEEQVSALRSEIDELTVTLQAKEREREQIARQAGEAEKGLAEVTERLGKAEQLRRETERQLTEEAALLRAELERKEELLVQSRRAHTEQRDELEQKIASMDKAEAALSELIKAKETELAEARNSLDQASERAGFLEAELSSLETAYQEAEDDRKQQQEELEAVRAELVSLQDEKISVEGKLQGKLEGLEEQISGFHAEVNDLTHTVQEKERIEEDLERRIKESVKESVALRSEIDKLSLMVQDKENEKDRIDQRALELRKELTETEERLAESEQHISEIRQINVDLDEENTRLVSAAGESKQLYADLKRKYEDERTVLAGEIERLQNERAGREQQLADVRAELTKQHEDERTVLSEKIESLRNEVAEQSDQLERLRTERDHQTRRGQELENLYSDVRKKLTVYEKDYAYGERINVSEFTENQELAFQSSGNSDTRRPTTKKGIDSGKRSWLYAGVFLAAIIIVTALFSEYDTSVREKLRTRFPQKPLITDSSEISDTNVSFTPITASRVSGNVKIRAAFISEALLAKENTGGDQSLFDFRNFYYFRVHITALEGSLDRELVMNPVSHVQLTDGSKRISPEKHLEKMNLRTIYKRDMPLSVSFLCMFPKDTFTDAPKKLDLIISLMGNPVLLSWGR